MSPHTRRTGDIGLALAIFFKSALTLASLGGNRGNPLARNRSLAERWVGAPVLCRTRRSRAATSGAPPACGRPVAPEPEAPVLSPRSTYPGYLQVGQHVDSTLGVSGGYRANFVAEAMKLDIDARIAHG
jgi:hypothetical protein